jgi:hypothetical protein
MRRHLYVDDHNQSYAPLPPDQHKSIPRYASTFIRGSINDGDGADKTRRLKHRDLARKDFRSIYPCLIQSVRRRYKEPALNSGHDQRLIK